MEQLPLEIGLGLVIQGEHWYFHSPGHRSSYSSKLTGYSEVHFTQSTVLHSCLCQPLHIVCVCVWCFNIYMLTFCNKLSRILSIKKLPYSRGKMHPSDRMKAFLPMHCYMEKHWVKIQLTGTSQIVHCSKNQREFMSARV